LEAIELYVRHRPDWVLMDIEMGRIDGISATRIIREIDASAKIIIVTMFDDPLLRSKSRHAGAAGYLSKKDLTGLPSMLV
jgi:DNA-binding NarL/FixJ family response regulator